MSQLAEETPGLQDQAYGIYESKRARKRALRFRGAVPLGIIWGSNSFVFQVLFLLHALASFRHPFMANGFTASCILVCLVLMACYKKNVYLFPLGATCLFTALIATLAGTSCMDNHSYYMFLYQNTRTYLDVLPTQKAQSVSDAGRLVFDEANLLQAWAMGYRAEDGHTYCVAPVMGLTTTYHVEFWAAGVDCCGLEADFHCDAAHDGGELGGIRLFPPRVQYGDRPSLNDRLDMARKKSEAAFDLVSSSKLMYLQWVKSGNVVKRSTDLYVFRTILTCVITSLVYHIFAGLFALGLYLQYFRGVLPDKRRGEQLPLT